MEIVIEKGIPAPEEKISFKPHLDKLKVGESFRVPHRYIKQLRTAVGNANSKSERKYVVAMVEAGKDGEPDIDHAQDNESKVFARAWRTQ